MFGMNPDFIELPLMLITIQKEEKGCNHQWCTGIARSVKAYTHEE
jgi:hypothetical protein